MWGAHGQEALEAARVCLLGAGPTGTEALKNLVLGGIHSFTIVDGARLQPSDLGNNFLLTAEGLAAGASRARCATGAWHAGVREACGEEGEGAGGRRCRVREKNPALISSLCEGTICMPGVCVGGGGRRPCPSAFHRTRPRHPLAFTRTPCSSSSSPCYCLHFYLPQSA